MQYVIAVGLCVQEAKYIRMHMCTQTLSIDASCCSHMYTCYRRTGFNYECLIIANCEVSFRMQLKYITCIYIQLYADVITMHVILLECKFFGYTI